MDRLKKKQKIFKFMDLSDMNNEQQVEENISYMKDFQPIEENERHVVEQVVRIIMEGNKGGKLNE